MAVEWWHIVVTVVCVILSGTFSGLTLGLMSLDLIDLRILIDSGTPRQSRSARRIQPVRRHGNFLLCTLLIGNTAVNSALSIVSSEIFGGILGFVTSTIAILYIGEIIPQAIGHRHGLEIGSYTIPFVKLCMLVTSPLSWPTSKLLDCVLGGESPMLYNKRQLKSLVTMHGETQATLNGDLDRDPELGLGPPPVLDGTEEHNFDDSSSADDTTNRKDEDDPSGEVSKKQGKNGKDKKSKKKGPGRILRRRASDRSSRDSHSAPAPALTKDEMTILEGALDFSTKSVEDVMTPLEKIFMLESSMVLDFKTMMLIFQSGHSRIPVYEKEKSNIVGYLFAKDLILLDPDEHVPVTTVISFFNRALMCVKSSTDLNKMLNIFKTGRGHMAIVTKVVAESREGEGEVQITKTIGIVTLEDLIEELIGDEIVDETDVYTNNSSGKRVPRIRRFDQQVLRLFDSHDRVEERLTQAEVRVVASYLADNTEEFSPEHVEKSTLHKVLKESPILHFADSGGDSRPASSSLTSGEAHVDHTDTAVCHARSDEEYLTGCVQFVKDDELAPTQRAELAQDNCPIVYKRNVPSSDAYLIISGRLKISAGSEGFESEVGPWTLLGGKALSNNLYAPDFTASVMEFPARLLKITRKQYRAMIGLRPPSLSLSSYPETSEAVQVPPSDTASVSKPQSNQVELRNESNSDEEGG